MTALEPGHHGEIVVWRVRRSEQGKWVRATGPRRSDDRYRARAYFRRHDGSTGDVSRRADSAKKAEALVQAALDELLDASDAEMTSATNFIDAGRSWLRNIHRPETGLAPSTIDM